MLSALLKGGLHIPPPALLTPLFPATIKWQQAYLVLSAGPSAPWTQGQRNELGRRPEPEVSSGICWEVPPKAGKSLRRGLEQMLQTQTKVRRACGAEGTQTAALTNPGGGDRAEGIAGGLRLQPRVLSSSIIHSTVEGPPPTQRELPGSPQWTRKPRLTGARLIGPQVLGLTRAPSPTCLPGQHPHGLCVPVPGQAAPWAQEGQG